MSLASKALGLVPKGTDLSGTPPEHYQPPSVKPEPTPTAAPQPDRASTIQPRTKERRVALGVRVLETDMERLEALMIRTKATKQALIDEALRDFLAACKA